MKKSFLFLFLLPFFCSGCGGNNQPEETITKTIKFSGEPFKSVSSSAGFQIDDIEFSKNVEILTNYSRNAIDFENGLSSLTCTKLNTAVWENVPYLCIGTGYYANDKFKSGIMVWNSDAKIYSVEIKVMNYAKENSYSGDIVDLPAKIMLNEETHDLTLAEGQKPQSRVFSKNFESGVYSFSLKSLDARVLLEELTITWKV